MENLLERIVCNFQEMQKVNQVCQCRNCNQSNSNNQYYSGNCHHGVYCRRCIELTNCACIRKEGANQEFNALAQQMRFRCVHAFEGCKQIVAYNDLEAHEHMCPYRKLAFPSTNPPFPTVVPTNNWSNNIFNGGPMEVPFKKLATQCPLFYPKEPNNENISAMLNRTSVIRHMLPRTKDGKFGKNTNKCSY